MIRTDMLCRTTRTPWHQLSCSQCYGTDMLCRTIRTRWYHQSSSQCYGTNMLYQVDTSVIELLGHAGIICPVVIVTELTCFIRYICYWNLQLLINVIIFKTSACRDFWIIWVSNICNLSDECYFRNMSCIFKWLSTCMFAVINDYT